MRKISNLFVALVTCVFLFSSCLEDGDYTIGLETAVEDGVIAGIPNDNLAGKNPTITSNTTTIPNVQYTTEQVGDDVVVRFDMTGVNEAESNEWLRLFGTATEGQNIWVSVDDKPKGIVVVNNADETSDKKMSADLVFTVDNSGSMSEEADAIARDIISWAKLLEQSGLDMRFGCVGYGYSYGYVYGAIDMATATELETYLNRNTGTERTYGYGGSNASQLSTWADAWSGASGENGVVAIKFANEYFNFRPGSNRIYVNFTDEPNQPGGNNKWSVEVFNQNSNYYDWQTTLGTIHTVFSASSSSSEEPWLMSEYTGGTTIKTNSSFTGVTLADLPVTGAMQNSYVIKFTNVEEFMDGQPHKVTITIKDGDTMAEKTFYIVFNETK